MKRVNRILHAPGRVLAKAPRWARMVWVLVLATGVGLGVAWAQDDAFARGYASGAAEAARQAVVQVDSRERVYTMGLDELPPFVNRDLAEQAAEQGAPFVWRDRGDNNVPCHPMLRLANGNTYYIPAEQFWGIEGDGRVLDSTVEMYGCLKPAPDRTIPGSWLTCHSWGTGHHGPAECVFKPGHEDQWGIRVPGGAQAPGPYWTADQNVQRESWTCRGGIPRTPGYVMCDW